MVELSLNMTLNFTVFIRWESRKEGLTFVNDISQKTTRDSVMAELSFGTQETRGAGRGGSCLGK